MSRTLFVRNRQRVRAIKARQLRSIAGCLLREIIGLHQFDLGIYLVTETEMTRINETFLGHRGCTDVIAFDYAETPRNRKRSRMARSTRPTSMLHGEIFICIAEAVRQSKVFKVSWQTELARYLVHGILHLCGFQDGSAAARKKMKAREDRLLEQLRKQIPLRAWTQVGKSSQRSSRRKAPLSSSTPGEVRSTSLELLESTTIERAGAPKGGE